MADTLAELTTDLQQYVVAPLNAFGVAGFVFDVEGEAQAELTAEITDHYSEDNRALQDHIAIRPKRITLKGYVGEVVYTVPNGDSSAIQQVTQKLTELDAFLPQFSAAAVQIQEAVQTETLPSLNSSSNLYGLVQNLIGTVAGPEQKQAQAFAFFKALMTQKILMGVQTPWEFMTNMAIISVRAIQNEVSRYISDFQITLKEIRIAQTLSTAYSNLTPAQQVQFDVATDPSKTYQGAAAAQAAPPVQIGNVQGVDPASSAAPTGPGGVADLKALENMYHPPVPASQLNPP